MLKSGLNNALSNNYLHITEELGYLVIKTVYLKACRSAIFQWLKHNIMVKNRSTFKHPVNGMSASGLSTVLY